MPSSDLRRLGLRECARVLGVSHPLLLRYKKKGFFPPDVVNEDGTWDAIKAKAAFDQRSDPAQKRKLGMAADLPAPPAESAQPRRDESEETGFYKVRTALTAVKLKGARLDLAEREKQLLSAAEVEQVWANHITTVKARLLLLPGKLAPRLAVCSDVLQCQHLIDRELRSILDELASNFEE
jgi:hypothetical protein